MDGVVEADWIVLARRLFPHGYEISERDCVLRGTAQVAGRTIAVVGTTRHTPIGVETALAQAQAVLHTVRAHPGRAIFVLVDTCGQRLRHRDEMLGINSYMAHLGKCIELARRRGHPVLALVYDQALSGGFFTSGMMADACHALPQATIRVMGLAAMARITKVPEERLAELAKDNPVFAPGPENYWRMGGIESIWDGDLGQCLEEALAAVSSVSTQSTQSTQSVQSASAEPAEPADPAGTAGTGTQAEDRRAALGFARGGRSMAQPVLDAILGRRAVGQA